MCGIFGYHNSVSLPGEAKANALACISHRGPDDKGTYSDDNLFFAHARLSIVDVSANGHQPMVSADDNYVIVFNGEIYNHQEIRAQLIQKGYVFRSGSDTETLLYAYAAFGKEVCNKLNGIFAFAVYDKQKQEIFIARDHFGTKPLYYYSHAGTFAFGSEIKSFLSLPGFDGSLNYSAFPFYLQMLYAPGTITPFQHVKKLEPGSFIQYDVAEKEFRINSYYSPSYHITASFTEKQWVEKVDAALAKAAERQLMSDVHVGTFLSGGIDSSLISALASKRYNQGVMEAFTISSNQHFYQEGFDDDERYASLLAKNFGMHLNHIPADFSIVEEFDTMIWHLDEPQADPAPLLVYRICQAASEKGIKVLLSGTAGDDIFTGYRRHQALQYDPYFSMIPQALSSAVVSVLSKVSGNTPYNRRLKKVLSHTGPDKYGRWASYFSWLPQAQVLQLFNKDIQKQLHQDVMPDQYYVNLLQSMPASTADVNKMLSLEMKTFLPDHNLNYTDKMSMATGVEVRVPFLDQELVQLVSHIPVELKMKGKETKYILKKVAERYLPKEVIYRKKTGFGAPVRRWIKEEMRSLIAERLSDQRLQEMELFDVKAVQQLIRNNQAGTIDASYTVWSLLAIESWMRQFKASEKVNNPMIAEELV